MNEEKHSLEIDGVDNDILRIQYLDDPDTRGKSIGILIKEELVNEGVASIFIAEAKDAIKIRDFLNEKFPIERQIQMPKKEHGRSCGCKMI